MKFSLPSGQRAIIVRRGATGLFALALLAGPLRADDVREAARRVMPATVAVAWQTGGDKPAARKAVAPELDAARVQERAALGLLRLAQSQADSVAVTSGTVVGAN